MNLPSHTTLGAVNSYITCLNVVQVDFKEFIQGVSQFSVKGDKLSKLRFAFRIYDMDNDGFISNGELFQVTHLPFTLHCTLLFVSMSQYA